MDRIAATAIDLGLGKLEGRHGTFEATPDPGHNALQVARATIERLVLGNAAKAGSVQGTLSVIDEALR